MTFLQPWVLWGLPLVLVPVILHLLNRFRHRPMAWGAMMFLRSATRKSTRYERLRQWLVLLCRTLAILGLLMALSRPLAGGWMGWLASGPPDTILILLDRSASMEAVAAGGATSKRDRALQLFSNSAKSLAGASRIVLIESARLEAADVPAPESLLDHPAAQSTDTAADLPSLVQAALDWIVDNQPGSVELWIASDAQASSWLPESDRWEAARAGLAGLPQSVRVRLLNLNEETLANLSLRARVRPIRMTEGGTQLDLTLDLEQSAPLPLTVPVQLNVNGAVSQLDVRMESTRLRYRHRITVAEDSKDGWGVLSLSADANPSDNDAYFAYSPVQVQRAAVVAQDPFVSEVARLAVAPDPGDTNSVCDSMRPDRAGAARWDNYGLVVWQGPLPRGESESQMRAFVEQGGVALLMPGGHSEILAQQGWDSPQETTSSGGFAISAWDEQDGPLMRTEEGFSLPLRELEITRRQPVVGEGRPLAWFEDGLPLLVRRQEGRGHLYVLATLPHPGWSRLHEGAVFVPMVRRLLEEGNARLGAGRVMICGEPVPQPMMGSWQGVIRKETPANGLRAGLFQSGAQWLVWQRPETEDDRARLEAEDFTRVFEGLSVQMFEEKRDGPARLQSELWRLFLAGMLVFLVVEASMILPPRRAAAAWSVAPNGGLPGRTDSARDLPPAREEVSRP